MMFVHCCDFVEMQSDFLVSVVSREIHTIAHQVSFITLQKSPDINFKSSLKLLKLVDLSVNLHWNNTATDNDYNLSRDT